MSYSIGCKTGNYSEVLLGVPQWTRTLSTGQECNCMSHLSLSFTQCQRRLPFKTLTICQESTLFKWTCNSTWTTLPLPEHSPLLHETKQNKKQNHPKWVKLWFSISIYPADFLAIFTEPPPPKKKKVMNCYGNKLMFWDYSFHYRKRSYGRFAQKTDTASFHTKLYLF